MGNFSTSDGLFHIETEPVQEADGKITGTKIKITSDKLYICAEIKSSPPWSKIKQVVEILVKKDRLTTMDVDRRIAEELEKLG